MKSQARLDVVKSNKLCFICLFSGHGVSVCQKAYRCSVPSCGKKHSKFIHVDTQQSRGDVTPAPSSSDTLEASASNASAKSNASRVYLPIVSVRCKGRHKRESKNAKQMRNTKQNCFSHSSASPRNDKQCSAKQCFANQTNRCLAGFASRSDLFRDNARLTKHRRKVNQRHLILQAMYTTM